jgi:ureidoacrylate peracid hydrolase
MIINHIKSLIQEVENSKASTQKALIIIDYTDQNVNKNEVKDWDLTLNKVKLIQPNIEKLIDYCRSKNYLIVFIATKEWSEKNLPSNINHLYKTNPDASFYSEGKDELMIKPKPNDQIFYKNKYSAFSGTNGQLQKYLQSQKINNLIICGIYSTGCVKDTIAEGFAIGYHMTIIKDCIETFDRKDKQQYQKSLLNDWPYMYGPVINLKEFINNDTSGS